MIAVVAGLVRLAGLPADSVMLLGGNNKASLMAISEFNIGNPRIRRSVQGGVSAGDLPEWKRCLKTQLMIALNATNGKPCCNKDVRKAIGASLWARLCVLNAAPNAEAATKELHAKGEATFVEEAGKKAKVWWNQSGAEAAKIKAAWALDKKKRSASASPAGESAAKRQPADAPAAASGGACMRL
jgi:hypothetical protein